ncbi:MAG: M13 family metallopeptidase, partial [Candidatus Eisenbacteria bacterium]
PIPADERGWSIADEVEEETYHQLRGICEAAAAAGAAAGSIEQKVGDFWAAAMDSARIETVGITTLGPELSRIDAIRTRADLQHEIAALHVSGVEPLYRLWIGLDDKNSSAYVVFLHQGGLGLPDRDYYFLDDPSTTRIREEYPGQIAAMFRLMGQGEEQARRAADAVIEIETALAEASRTLEERRDPQANYNKLSMEELGRLAPTLDIPGQLRMMGVAPLDSVVVGQPEFYARVDSALAAFPLEAWRDYLRWGLINTFANRLSAAFEQQDFRFYGTLLNGTPQQRPRWKRVLDAEEEAIGDLMGQAWVRRYCSAATRARYERLVDEIIDTYAERIRRLAWMSEPTKEKALAKLARVNKKVGYPDHWRDFSSLSLDRDSYVRNQIRVNEWWFRYRAAKLGQPVDLTEWEMTPQTYNAYYDGSRVEIVLPAAVFLIPGVPDSLIDDAVLYAYAGASTIGHELTHGFDDEGRQYDAEGNLRPWWTPEDSTQFARRAERLVEQFDAYVVGDKHVRGLATLGENIADLGGVVIGYDAFKKTRQYRSGEVINGLTPDQRYFLGYALAWLGHQRPELLAKMIMTDVHSPPFLRVNGPLANIPEFHRAFEVRPGDAMYRDEAQRVEIW